MKPLAVIVVAAVAGALAGVTAGLCTSPSPAAIEPTDSDLGTRLASLEERVHALAATAAQPRPAVATEGAVVDAARESLPAVDAVARTRLDALEQAMARLSTNAVAPQQPAIVDPAADAAARRADETKSVAEHQRAILVATTDAEKMAAWKQLRGLENAYDDATVAVMVQVGLSSQDPLVRADVWRQADGHSTHPALAPALLQALRVDGEPRVREEAAETLEKYLDVPGVREALQAAVAGDSDEGVKRQATRTLAPRR